MADQKRQTILTGDRPTGPLHLGHLAGSLANRVVLQDSHDQTVLVADMQGLSDNANEPFKVRDNVLNVVADYLAAGIDPAKTVICLQSGLPALAELTMLYSNLVTVSRLERNPTIRSEILARGFGRDIPAGFLCYPVSQASDITAFKATLVPVGADQLPLIELCNEIVDKVNRLAGRVFLPNAVALVPAMGRLPGVDGIAKMGKSTGNAIPLDASPQALAAAVQRMYTDPKHLKVSDPGTVEGNVVFAYLDAFDTDLAGLEELKADYRRGGLGDATVKRRLLAVLEAVVAPIRERRSALSSPAMRDFLTDILREGTAKARSVTGSTAAEIREALGVFVL